MAIEPLGSVMSIQAQGVVNKMPTQEVKQADESMTIVQDAVKVDKTTSVVENAKQKDRSFNQEKDQQGREPSQEQIKKAVEQLNKNMPHSEAVFGIHESTNRVMIKIVDKDTKEVIKELPPEKTLDMISKVWELAGIMVDEKR